VGKGTVAFRAELQRGFERVPREALLLVCSSARRWALACLTGVFIVGLAYAADLEVEVRGVKPQRGEIVVGLFDNERDFSLDLEVRAMVSTSGEISAGIFSQAEHLPRPPTRGTIALPTADTITLHFTGLSPGEYAVALFQDLNSNGRLDMTLGRIPVEPWGLSNNPRPPNRPATWDDAKFMLPEGTARIVIDLHLH